MLLSSAILSGVALQSQGKSEKENHVRTYLSLQLLQTLVTPLAPEADDAPQVVDTPVSPV